MRPGAANSGQHSSRRRGHLYPGGPVWNVGGSSRRVFPAMRAQGGYATFCTAGSSTSRTFRCHHHPLALCSLTALWRHCLAATAATMTFE
jgi:hypothetical protein